jgi:hypothetical protein
MKRLVALILSLGTAASAAANLAESREWQFRVLLDGKEIGYHDFVVSSDGERRTVETNAEFDVKLLFVNVYRYRHQNREEWNDNCLTQIDAETDANGEDFMVRGASGPGNFTVETLKTAESLPACIMTFAYWNPDFLNQRQLLNSQTGEYETVSVVNLGTDSVRVGDQILSANKYRLDAKGGPITLWYAAEDYRWLALESIARGGRILRYEPLVVPPVDSQQAAPQMVAR